MKCHHPVYLWKGIDSRDDLTKILPSTWRIKSFVDFDQAKKMGGGVKGHALCAVPTDVDTPCEELKQGLHDAIDKAMFPDDEEDESDC